MKKFNSVIFSKTLTLLFVVSCLISCKSNSVEIAPVTLEKMPTAGEPRNFSMGFSAIPKDDSEHAYLRSYDFAANYGETLVIRSSPFWKEFFRGSIPSEKYTKEILAQKHALKARNLNVVYVLDVFDPADRSSLFNLPAEYYGQSLASEKLKEALAREAIFVIHNLNPEIFVLGNEINMTFEQDADSYFQFVEAYKEIYDLVKDISPQTKVMTSFQYEELLGNIPWGNAHVPRWELLDDFSGRNDLLGITTYPSFFIDFVRRLDSDYYLQIREYSDLPIAFISAAYSSGKSRDGFNISTPIEQRRYLRKLLADADILDTYLIIWPVVEDGSLYNYPDSDLIKTMGLLDSQGIPKDAWSVWVEGFARPRLNFDSRR